MLCCSSARWPTRPGYCRQGGEEMFAAGLGGTGVPHVPAHAEEARTAQEFLDFLEASQKQYEKYLQLTEKGVSRELARMGLPVSVYTEWYWKCDLHNILRFLSLRMDAHAQLEIRAFANAMFALLEPIVPVTMEAFRDYDLGAVSLTGPEVAAIRAAMGGKVGEIASTNSREQAEWTAKRARLGL